MLRFTNLGDYQVVQREATNEAQIDATFTRLNAGASIRVVATDQNGAIINESRLGPRDPASLKLPSGGWYKIWVQETTSDFRSVLSEGVVPHIGIGEVFLVAGQSNSEATGESPQANPDLTSAASASADGIVSWRHKVDHGTLGSVWPAFLTLTQAKLKIPVAVVELGCGGTIVSQWLPAASGAVPATICGSALQNQGALYSRLSRAARNVGRFRAVLWHQGESDAVAGTSASDYQSRLEAIIAQFATDVGTPVPWLVSNASFTPGALGTDTVAATCELKAAPIENRAKMLPIRSAQQNLWKNGRALRGPDTDPYIGPFYRFAEGACVHLSNNGLNVVGQLWYKSVSEAGITPGLESPAALPAQSIYRFYSPQPDHWFRTDQVAPAGYAYEGVAFKTFVNAGPELSALNACTFSNGSHFLSRDAGCEGQTVSGALGYVSQSPARVGLAPIYRFYSEQPQTNFLATSHFDEGLQGNAIFAGILGYAPKF